MDTQTFRRKPTVQKRCDGKSDHARETLGGRVDLPFYRVEWLENPKSNQRSDPWIVWTSPDDHESRTDVVEDGEKVRKRIYRSRNLSLEIFLQTDEGEIFRPRRFYGNPEERKSKLADVVSDMMGEMLAADGSVPASEAVRLGNREEEFRKGEDGTGKSLDDYTEQLQAQVLTPLRRALIACLIEASRDLVDSDNWPELTDSRKKWKEWEEMVVRAANLLRIGVVKGRSLTVILDMARTGKAPIGAVPTQIFDRVPGAVASGFETALKFYVKNEIDFLTQDSSNHEEESMTDYSRDGILDRAESVYFRWLAARLMHRSAMEDIKLEKAMSEAIPEGRPFESIPSEISSSKSPQSESHSPGDEKKILKYIRSGISNKNVPKYLRWRKVQSSSISELEDDLKEAVEEITLEVKSLGNKNRHLSEENKDSIPENLLENLFTDYKPSPGASKVWKSIVEAHEKGLNLRDFEGIGNMIEKSMNENSILKELRPKNPTTTIRKDIKRELENKGFEDEKIKDIWPYDTKDPSEIVDLALECSKYSQHI